MVIRRYLKKTIRRVRERVDLVLSRGAPAERRAVKARAKVERVDLSFEVYAQQFLERKTQKLKSTKDYESVMRRHLLPYFGERSIAELTPGDINAFADHLRAKQKRNGQPYAPNSIHNTYGLLRNILRTAERKELIDRCPCLCGTDELPKKRHVDPEFRRKAVFTGAELVRIIDSPKIPLEPWRALYATLFLTGMRLGEALALRWARVELEAKPLGRIVIVESYSTKNRKAWGTKTGEVREAPIHPRLDGILRAYAPKSPEPTALVFPNANGAHISGTYALAVWHKHLDALGLRRRRLHDTRRTFVSLSSGAPDAKDRVLHRITHGREGEVREGYKEITWEETCREILKWKI